MGKDEIDLTEKQILRRGEILDSATKLFLNEGYGRTTMDNVLTLVGGSKRTLYKYFPNKEALFTAIIEQVSDRVLSAFTPLPREDTFREALIDMGARYLQVMTSAECISLYRAMVAEAPHFPDLADNFLQNGPFRASQHLAEYLRSHAKNNRLRITDPDLCAAQFMGAVRGNVHFHAVFNGQVPTKKETWMISETAVETLLNGWCK
ncbi:TetR/AcrR family transcriptional regulator [Kiloniella majae]|uniref:TetR/AcrR family transcriptional regulator n=1 Tax=Kiloniella majae TaxID=1938558 RepID=UPI0015C52033|nr:TetR/AcrR family transcriptional regulator [Kiloniella majae]